MKHDFICEKTNIILKEKNQTRFFAILRHLSLSFYHLSISISFFYFFVFLQVDKRCGSDVNLLKPY